MPQPTAGLLRLFRPLAAAAAAALAAPAFPQAPTAPAPQPVVSSAPAEPVGPTITIRFPGGTLAAYVQSVREAAAKAGQAVNIILPKEAGEETVPPIALTDVSTRTALQSLTYAYPESAGVKIAARAISGPGEQSVTYALQYADRLDRAVAPTPRTFTPERASRVHSLRTLIEAPEGLPPDPALAMPVDEVLSALRAAAELEAVANQPGEASAPPEFLLHKESKLLICRGTDSQQRLVEAVLNELRATVEPRRARAAEAVRAAATARMQELTLKAQIEQQSIMLDRAEKEFALATANLGRVEQLHAAGQAAATELDIAKRQHAEAMSNVEQSRSNIRNFEAQLGVVKSQIATGGPAAAAVPVTPQSVRVTYEVRDIEPLHADLYRFCKLVVPGDWEQGEPYISYALQPSRGQTGQRYAGEFLAKSAWSKSGKAVIPATPDQHRLIVQYLNAIRRAKAGEPNLPGLDADQLIEQARAQQR